MVQEDHMSARIVRCMNFGSTLTFTLPTSTQISDLSLLTYDKRAFANCPQYLVHKSVFTRGLEDSLLSSDGHYTLSDFRSLFKNV